MTPLSKLICKLFAVLFKDDCVGHAQYVHSFTVRLGISTDMTWSILDYSSVDYLWWVPEGHSDSLASLTSCCEVREHNIIFIWTSEGH